MRSPCHIRMYKTNINIFHKQILIKSCKKITMTILLVNMWHKLQLASVCKLYCLLPALPEVRSLWPTPRYSWPQQACPRDGGRPGDAQVQSAIAEKHVYCVKNLLALPCLTSIWYSIYMYLPRQTSFDLRKQHLDFRLLVLVLRCLLNPIHRLLVFVSLSFCFSVFSPVCLS